MSGGERRGAEVRGGEGRGRRRGGGTVYYNRLTFPLSEHKGGVLKGSEHTQW